MDGFSIIDRPRRGSENMAIDQQLLELAAEKRKPILRLYEWSEPTLSLGYFQKVLDRKKHATSESLPIVRRATGGGAIVHHHEWTYSVALPDDLIKTNLGAAASLYQCMHSATVRWLGTLDLPAQCWQADQCSATALPCSFLCFERRSSGDVVVNPSQSSGSSLTGAPMPGSKVMGSAQRRIQGALLQHGSLLVSRSQYAPSLAGIAELCPSIQNEDSMRHSFFSWLSECLCSSFDIRLEKVDALSQLITGPVSQSKFDCSSWTDRR